MLQSKVSLQQQELQTPGVSIAHFHRLCAAPARAVVKLCSLVVSSAKLDGARIVAAGYLCN